jgi:N-acetylneuraminate synthase
MGAIALGAVWIERHFTKNRTFKGTDHSASLEPPGLQKLVRDAEAIGKALAFKPSAMSDVEVATRKKLKFG